jgi:hypothetical protein
VDRDDVVPAKRVLFAQLSGESRKPQTRWRSEWNSNLRATFQAAFKVS